MNEKLEARKRREAEIAAFALEMSSSEAKFIAPPTINNDIRRSLGNNYGIGSSVTDDIGDDNCIIVEGIYEEDDEEDDNDDENMNGEDDQLINSHGITIQKNIEDHVADISNLKNISTGDEIDEIAVKRKIPIAYQVDLVGHSKAVTCLSIEPTGNRLVTGSLDYCMKLYDFGGMDTRHRAFFNVEVEEGHPITSVAHSPSGDKFIVSTGSCQPRVYDREGKEVIKFVRGDMYLRDLTNTKGHVMEVTCVFWHPIDKNVLLTGSLDGTIRIWDLTGEAAFGNLINKNVLKIRSGTGQGRVGCTSCCYTSNANRIYGGCSDGTLHIWLVKTGKIPYSRADAILQMPDSCKTAVSALTISKDNNTLAARSEGGRVTLWDITKLQAVLFRIIIGIDNSYNFANMDFSPDSSLICCGTTPLKGLKSQLVFFDTQYNRPLQKAPVIPISPTDAFMKISVAQDASVIAVRWQANIRQIFCTLSSGLVRVFFDPRFSVKGAMISAAKAPKREKDPTDFAVYGEIITPHAPPLFREPEKNAGKVKYQDRKDPIKSKMPSKNVSEGPKKAVNNSFFFTKFISETRNKDDNLRAEDPREALLKYDALSKADPMFLGAAYQTTQPKAQLYSMTFEQEQEEFRKKQKKDNF